MSSVRNPAKPYGDKIGATHDHCIDVMLSCKHLIYIFGDNYGGKYHGSDYEQYAAECSSIIKIPPSISFMEYLVAKRFGKNTKVYVAESVDIAHGEWLANDSPDDYSSKVVDYVETLKQLGYFDALGNGTWYDKYSDKAMLEKFIDSHFPPIHNQKQESGNMEN